MNIVFLKISQFSWMNDEVQLFPVDKQVRSGKRTRTVDYSSFLIHIRVTSDHYFRFTCLVKIPSRKIHLQTPTIHFSYYKIVEWVWDIHIINKITVGYNCVIISYGHYIPDGNGSHAVSITLISKELFQQWNDEMSIHHQILISLVN